MMSQEHRVGPPAPRAASENPETEEQRKARDHADQRKMREQAEALTANLPRLGDPQRRPMTAAEALLVNEPTVRMLFPHKVTLTLSGDRCFQMVAFDGGYQDVPLSLSDDPYLAANGARRA